MNHLRRRGNSIFLVAVVTAVLCGPAIYLYRQPISWVLWQHFHLDSFAIILNSSDANLAFNIGNYFFGEGGYDVVKAEQYIKRALAINDGIPEAHYQLARIYFIQSDFKNALVEINKELAFSPYFYRSYYVRGLIYGYDAQYDKAAADFKAYLIHNPTSWAAHNDLAWTYFSKGDYAGALATARDGLTYAPHNPWLLNTLGAILLNEGRRTEAKQAFDSALQTLRAMTPDDWGAAYPGNDPAIYTEGLSAMRASIERNLDLLNSGSG